MIDKDLFFNLISQIHNVDCFVNELYRIKFDITDNPLFAAYYYMLDRVWEAYFTEDGVDIINWFIFEHHSIGDDFDSLLNMIEPGQLSMKDENGNNIPMDTIDDLWNYVKNFRK